MHDLVGRGDRGDAPADLLQRVEGGPAARLAIESTALFNAPPTRPASSSIRSISAGSNGGLALAADELHRTKACPTLRSTAP